MTTPDTNVRGKKVKIGNYISIAAQGDGRQVQTCDFCGYSRSSVVFQATKWSVHILGCPRAPSGTSILTRARSVTVDHCADGQRMHASGPL
jgi:hypothetical protein